MLSEQVRLCEIPAPPFTEQQRAQAYKAAFERLGLKNVRIDAVGNVLGERPGRQPQAARGDERAPRHRLPRGHDGHDEEVGDDDRRAGDC